MNYAEGGTRQIYYCFHSGHRQSGQPPRTKERSECQLRHATILHHGILNLMFNAVNHPPSQIHIHSHKVAHSKCRENIFSYKSVSEKNKEEHQLLIWKYKNNHIDTYKFPTVIVRAGTFKAANLLMADLKY